MRARARRLDVEADSGWSRPRWRALPVRIVLCGTILAALLSDARQPSRALPALVGPPVEIAYIERRIERQPALNNEDQIPSDEGLVGATLGARDSNATGRFVGIAIDLKPQLVEPQDDIRAALRALIVKDNPRFVVVNAPADDVLALADMPEARNLVLFNIAATDTRLRDRDCRANVLHVAPSRTMLVDALMQFLVFKRWTRILLVSGPHPNDRLFADALRQGAHKFGAQIVGEATFDAHGADIRDTAMREFALVTRGADHDVVAVADEADEFGNQLVYNTDRPRPVVGTHGLVPTAWGRPVEAWAAVQLQGRFRKLAGRPMRAVDYAGWMAVHVVGEAAVQIKSADTAAIHDRILSTAFEVGGFKGRALSFRSWNGELRQPIFDLWSGAVVATAPLEGFLHEKTDLDTLGLDAAESACRRGRG